MSDKARPANENVDSMMNDIIEALEIIKQKLPNGELKLIQERIENIDSTQEDMKEDLRAIKRQLMDPEDGIIVRVNKNTEFRKKKEQEDKDYAKMLDEHKELVSFKATATKVLWIIFTAIAGIIVALFYGQYGGK